MLALLAFIAGLLIYLTVSVSRITKMGIQIKRMLLQLISARVMDMTGGETTASAADDDVEVAHDRHTALTDDEEDEEEEEDAEVCSITAGAAAGADDGSVDGDELSEISLEDGEEARIQEETEVPEGPPP